jgi:hypothetical protein
MVVNIYEEAAKVLQLVLPALGAKFIYPDITLIQGLVFTATIVAAIKLQPFIAMQRFAREQFEEDNDNGPDGRSS